MSAPKVTVLMTVCNAEKYLRQAIESVLNQTFTDFELLITDDASTDSSPEIIRSYQDPRIRVIRNSTNRGVAYSRKEALELARGEYVAVLDADDVAFKERLQVQVDYLDANADIHLVGSAYEVIDENGNVECTQTVPTDPLTIRWNLLFGNCIAHSTAMFRRATALEIGGYDEQVFAGEDFDLWVRFAAHSKIAQLDRPLARWRRHRQSLQYSEPVEAKDHFIWTVVKSIRLQTNQKISFEVAKCLYRSLLRPCDSAAVVCSAYSTIQDCLNSFLLRSDLTETDRKNLVLLALEDVSRVANQNPSSRWRAWRMIAWRCAANLDCLDLFSKRFVKLILKAFLPSRVIRLFRVWLQRLRKVNV